jgi:electron transfer flavoprotein alpha subunit
MTRPRKDPRAERQARRVADSPRPRFTLETAAPRRPRRDPRREQALALVPGTHRPRLDRTGRAAGAAVPTMARMEAVAAAPAAVFVAEPAFLVLVVTDAPNGRLSPHDRQLLGAGRILADAGGGAVVLVAGALADDPGVAGADRALTLAADRYDPEGRAAMLLAAIAALAPRHVVFPETPDGGDLARRVAAALGESLFAAAESVTAKAVSRAARGGRVEQRRSPPRLLSVVADAVAAHAGPPHEVRPLDVPAVAEPVRGLLAAEPLPADSMRVPLAEASFVVSAGNGVTDFAAFRTLAQALGATPGASRVVCDAGLMPRAAQVGASGTVLEASCYFALGIAGAPQHLQGVARCEHVVAVNTDLHAAMVERAGLAVIADAQRVMPALLAALESGERQGS